jgi:hypothetical protein
MGVRMPRTELEVRVLVDPLTRGDVCYLWHPKQSCQHRSPYFVAGSNIEPATVAIANVMDHFSTAALRAEALALLWHV